MTIQFSFATKADIPILMTHMRAFHEFDHDEPFDELPARAAMTQVVTDSNIGRVWLIQQSKGIPTIIETVGYIVVTISYRLEYRGYYAFLDELYICEDHRGKGIGTQAIKFLTEACKRLPVSVIQLEVQLDNPYAAELYQKVGFVQQHRSLFTYSVSSHSDQSSEV